MQVTQPLGAITQEAGNEPAQHRMDVLAADFEFAGDLNGQVAARG